jgi:WD40 repeat protein
MTVAFAPDGRQLVSGCLGKSILLWDVARGTLLKTILQEGRLGCRQVSFSPDGQAMLATCGNMVRVWDVATWKEKLTPLQHAGNLQGAWFSPDGKRILTASADTTARVWDAATGRPLTLVMEHKARVSRAAFSPDGQLIVTADGDGSGAVRFWDAQTGQPITAPMHATGVGSLFDICFSPDGRHVLAGGGHKDTPGVSSALLWSVPEPGNGRPLNDLVRHAELNAGARIDSSFGLTPLDTQTLRQHFLSLRDRYPSEYKPGRKPR